MLEPLFNKAAGLNVCNSIKKRLQQRRFLLKVEKFLRTPFFTEEFQWLLLSVFSKEFEAKTDAIVSNKY